MKDNGVIEEVEKIVVLLSLDIILPSPLLFYFKLCLYKTIEREEVSKRIQLAFNLLFSFELCSRCSNMKLLKGDILAIFF